jgi:hypothetical protein
MVKARRTLASVSDGFFEVDGRCSLLAWVGGAETPDFDSLAAIAFVSLCNELVLVAPDR